jgi:asparagine synthase (glutamine-hydrolysing)
MVAAYLQNQFRPLDWTFYEGIFQLKPAHALLVRPDGSPETWCYWDIDPSKQIRYEDERDYAAHFREVFTDAVRARLRSTAPVGLFLSGGVDSGSIASMAGHLKEKEGLDCPAVRTYSWAFETLTQCDERDVSTQITERYDFSSTPVDAESIRLIGPPNGVPDRDSPLMSHYQALIATGLEDAQEHGVRCMLSGQHGDLLVGSWIFDNITLLREGELSTLWKELQAQREALGLSLRDLIRRTLYQPIRAQIWPEDTLPRLREPLRRLWRTMRPAPSPAPAPPWMSENLRNLVDLSSADEEILLELRQFARRQRYEAIHTPLQRRIATWSERLFARHQMTYADPWADRRLIEYVMAIPQHRIFRHGQNKYLARRALKGLMPEAARARLQKVSPTPLYELELKDGTSAQIHSYFHVDNPFLDVDRLRVHYKARREGRTEEDFRFWLALCLLMWMHHNDL